MRQLIAIFGGTFDPVHYGHLRAALEAAGALDCAEMRLVPARVPPHRDAPWASPEHRLAMLELALRGQSRLTLDRRELEREGPSYTVDTLVSLRQEFPRQPLALVLGEDAFAGLSRWYQWERLVELAHLVVLTRPGAARVHDTVLEDLIAQRRVDSADTLAQKPAGGILPLKVTALGISASRIRQLVAAGGSARYLLPDRVLEYIHRQALYRQSEDG